MKTLLRPLQKNETDEIYHLFQQIPSNEKGFDNQAFGILRKEFQQFINKNIAFSKGIGLDIGYTSHTIYIFFVNDSPVGISKIRTYSDQDLLKRGGHIGCSIIPSKRGLGYGSLLLKETIKIAQDKKHLQNILLGCYTDNIASCRMIEKNGAVLEESINNISWYWVKS